MRPCYFWYYYDQQQNSVSSTKHRTCDSEEFKSCVIVTYFTRLSVKRDMKTQCYDNILSKHFELMSMWGQIEL